MNISFIENNIYIGRKLFYRLLCIFGRKLNIVLNSEIVYSELEREKREKYKKHLYFGKNFVGV